MSDDGLAAFYAARLDEDEAAAKAAAEDHPALEARGGHWQDVGSRHVRYDSGAGETVRSVDVTGGPGLWYEQITVRGDPDGHVAAHIARHDPARVLRDVAAKRAILAEHASSGGMYPTCRRCATWEPGTWYGDEEDGEEPPDGMSSVSYPCRTVRQLGTEFSDHPDYRKEWATT